MAAVDTYINEAMSIVADQRELNDRFRELRKKISQRSPELLKHNTDFLFSGAEAAEHLVAYLNGEEEAFLHRNGREG